ncbi:MAG: 50S ribosomal protein L2 [Candidatus Thermoplasmatota archaeon]|nr:50S ribosomal protein L2 [Candidatus Thermoplasmatota archaeon]
MGKRLRSQRRGKGSRTYSSPSHRHRGPVNLPKMDDLDGVVVDLVHSPGHTAPLAKVRFGEKEVLMLASDGLQVGETVSIGKVSVERGHVLPLSRIPESTLVFDVESKPGDGGKFARSAGTAAMIVSHGAETVIRLPSGKYRSFDPKCRAIVGVVAGSGRGEKPFAKAGKKVNAYRSKAKAPFRTSGVAMNPVNHPHGGGSHQHVGKPSTVSANAPPGRKVGRLSPKKKKKRRN